MNYAKNTYFLIAAKDKELIRSFLENCLIQNNLKNKKMQPEIVHFHNNNCKLSIRTYDIEKIREFRTTLFNLAHGNLQAKDYLEFKEAVLKIEMAIEDEITKKGNYTVLDGLVLSNFEGYFQELSEELKNKLSNFLRIIQNYLRLKYGQNGEALLHDVVSNFGKPLTVVIQ